MGLFSKKTQDPKKKEAIELKKELRKLVKQKKYDEALKIGLEVIQKLPYENDVLFIIGSIYYMQNKHKTAISYFDKSLQIGEYDTHALLLKANSHFNLGEMKQCKFCCDKILEIDPKNKGVKELQEKIENVD